MERVIIVDDELLFQAHLEKQIYKFPDIHVIGKFENGLIHPFYNILDCIRERNGLEPLNLDPKY